MKVRITWPTGTHKKGEEVEVSQAEGSALVTTGCAEVLEFDKPAADTPKAVMEKETKGKK